MIEKIAQVFRLGGSRNQRRACTMQLIVDHLRRVSRAMAKLSPPASSSCHLASSDVATLLASGLVTADPLPAQAADLSRELRMFTVPEKEIDGVRPCSSSRFSRRRLITHTPQTNRLFQEFIKKHKLKLPTQRQCMEAASKCFAYDIDLKSCYHQHALPADLRLWSFVADGIRLRLTTIPTGASWCPLFAHLFTEALASSVAELFPGIVAHVYIDNIRFAGDDLELLQRCLRKFYELASDLQVDINEPLDEVLARNATTYTFLGVAYDHTLHSTCISQKLATKLVHIRDTPISSIQQFSVRQTLTYYGILSSASCISGNCRGAYYHLTKFLRRRVGTDLEDPARVWPSIAGIFAQWATDELSARSRIWLPVTKSTRPQEVLMFTDASTTGYGVILYANDGSVHIYGGRWDESASRLHINILEAFALLHGFEFVAATFTHSVLAPVQLHIRVDNTSVLYRTPAGSATSRALNNAVRSIHDHALWPQVVSMQYVASADNPADWVSRLEGPCLAHLDYGVLRLRTLRNLFQP